MPIIMSLKRKVRYKDTNTNTPAVVQEVRGDQHKVHVGRASQLHALLCQLHTLVCSDGGVDLKGSGQEGELQGRSEVFMSDMHTQCLRPVSPNSTMPCCFNQALL